VCVACGVSLKKQGAGASGVAGGADKKLPAGICGILLGSIGVHKFILGYNTQGIIMLLVTLLTFGVGGLVMGPIGLIEGVIYLSKSDEDFVASYIENRKGWF